MDKAFKVFGPATKSVVRNTKRVALDKDRHRWLFDLEKYASMRVHIEVVRVL